MEQKLSIIVPVYNTEKYVDTCVASLVNQLYTNLEILLIDDGSTDSSGRLCDAWAKKDSRIRVLHQENGGQCTARNAGLDAAQGEYIAFVDSDDYVEPDMYACLLQDMWEHHADIACCRSTSCAETGGSKAVEVFGNDEVVRRHLLDLPGLGQSPCDKVYKKELFSGVRFANIRAYEDCATIYKVLFRCRTLVYRDAALYHYIPRENSTMTQRFSAVKFKQIEAYRLMYQDYSRDYPLYAHLVKRKLVGSCQYCIGESYQMKKQKAYCNEIQKARVLLKQLPADGLPLKLKLTKVLMAYFPCAFGVLYCLLK